MPCPKANVQRLLALCGPTHFARTGELAAASCEVETQNSRFMGVFRAETCQVFFWADFWTPRGPCIAG
jgi:hypothetical protein